jgi:hypothetical protein
MNNRRKMWRRFAEFTEKRLLYHLNSVVFGVQGCGAEEHTMVL